MKAIAIVWLGMVLVTSSAAAAEDVDALLARCAPNVHPETMRAVLSTESRGNVLAIADAGPLSLPWSKRKHLVRSLFPTDKVEAVGLVKDLLAKGHTVSIGLSQINDRNLPRLGISIEDIFEPCTNVKAGAQILTQFYQSAMKQFGPGPKALRAALSSYNSGDFYRGEQDGYVDLVVRAAGKPLVLVEGRNMGQQSLVSTVPSVSTAGGVGGQPVPSSRRSAKGWPAVKKPRYAREDFTLTVTSFESRLATN